MRIGVLDVGSNTVHLLVVDARAGGAPVPAASLKRDVRLAQHIEEGQLSAQGIQALEDVVVESRQFAEDSGCGNVLPFVTSALREATNCDDVLNRIRRSTGVELNVLAGIDEARATFLAARRWYGWSAGALAVFDIGGGSLELACGRDEEPEVALSVPVGAGRMMRRFGDANLQKMRRYVRAEIGNVVGDIVRRGPFDRTVATSKTFKALGRLTGAAPSSEGPFVLRTLSRQQLSTWVGRLAEMSPAERAQLPGVPESRADQILAGAVVAEAVMDLAGVEYLDLCPWALREGVILNYLDHLDYFANTATPNLDRADGGGLIAQLSKIASRPSPLEDETLDIAPPTRPAI